METGLWSSNSVLFLNVGLESLRNFLSKRTRFITADTVDARVVSIGMVVIWRVRITSANTAKWFDKLQLSNPFTTALICKIFRRAKSE